MVTVRRMVTIQFQPFLPCVNLVIKNSYGTGLRISYIITGWEFGYENDGTTAMREGMLKTKFQSLPKLMSLKLNLL